MVVIGIAICLLHFSLSRWIGSAPVPVSRAIVILTILLTVGHAVRILPYTPLMPTQAKGTGEVGEPSEVDPKSRLRVLVSNMELENDRYSTWLQTVRGANADIVIALEPGKRWVEKVESIFNEYPHRVIYPQENWYGMMMLSRLPIESNKIRFLVQDDVPSIDATIRMNDAQSVRVIGVHPRPPEPIRDNDATARDAELVLWGRELKKETGPVIIGGDLNDVAWSQTTRLFLRSSGLLDPRRGRGLFNSFHADHWWMRFPLDHIFHSTHFTVNGIERLSHVGSDHFPIVIDLQLVPASKDEHEVLEQKEDDQEKAELRVQRAIEKDDLVSQPAEITP